ncbi:M15 family metallopeptidase [Candidatus Saccharibacteria bacterium]|nr:M15 family metallopeptidase [Candidatus Saccharibacteria bacterium]
MIIPHKKRTKLHYINLVNIVLLVSVVGFGTYINLDLARKTEILDQQITNNRIILEKSSAIISAAAKKRQPVYVSLPGADTIRAIRQDYMAPDSLWTIINKTHSISTDYVPSSLSVPNVPLNPGKTQSEMSVRSDIKEPLETMFAAAKTAGFSLMLGSGYRSAALQRSYFNSLAASVGDTAANQAIAYPGQSEHQSGLAADISLVSSECYLSNCFATTGAGKWLEDNSYKYGFILRYPSGKESITQYQYEPWHFRYVDIDLATALYQSGLTLDEAWSYLQAADDILRSNQAI